MGRNKGKNKDNSKTTKTTKTNVVINYDRETKSSSSRSFPKIRIPYLIIWVVALFIIASALLILEKDFLWKTEEVNLFQYTTLFFKQQMLMPGGLLTYLGTYLTQYLHYPWLGTLILVLCWLLLMWLTKRAFQIPGKWALLMLIPVVLLLTTIVDVGYWLYILKLRGHFFVATLGALFVTASLWIYRSFPKRYHLRAVFIVLIALLGYPMAGIYGLASTLLMGLFSWRLESKLRATVYSVLALLATIAIPLLCYRYMYHEINLANIYWAELPLFFIQEDYHNYYIPYYLLALFFIVLVFTYRASWTNEIKKYRRWLVAQTAIVALLFVIAVKGWYRDENYHHELAMQHHIEQLNWDAVLQEAVQQKDEPTRAIVMMKNLALSRLGRQGNEMYYYRNGSKQSNAPFVMRMMLVAGPLIYYQYGMTNYCARISMEMGVEFGWRPDNLKFLARCALLNGEWQVARKYIHQLKQTKFYADWANHAEELLNNPEKIAKDPEMAPIVHMMHYENKLTSDQGFVEKFLMTQLASSRETDDPVFQEQSLLASLWTKDSKEFWYHFNHYVQQHSEVPLHYQEAAFLFGTLEERPDMDDAPFSPKVKDTFGHFAEQLSQYDGMDIEDGREMLREAFSNTFYYDYFLMSNLPEY